jgi:hypothetical protein
MGGLVPVEEIIPDIVSYFGQIWNLRNGLDKYIFQIQSDWNQLGTKGDQGLGLGLIDGLVSFIRI